MAQMDVSISANFSEIKKEYAENKLYQIGMVDAVLEI
jgi:hypothetical protein